MGTPVLSTKDAVWVSKQTVYLHGGYVPVGWSKQQKQVRYLNKWFRWE